jgi:hypothetical protein
VFQRQVDTIERHSDEDDGRFREVQLSQVRAPSEGLRKQSCPSCPQVPSAKRNTVYISHSFEIINSGEPYSSSRRSPVSRGSRLTRPSSFVSGLQPQSLDNFVLGIT